LYWRVLVVEKLWSLQLLQTSVLLLKVEVGALHIGDKGTVGSFLETLRISELTTVLVSSVSTVVLVSHVVGVSSGAVFVWLDELAVCLEHGSLPVANRYFLFVGGGLGDVFDLENLLHIWAERQMALGIFIIHYETLQL
jgi:hypothetical protein